MTYHKVLVETYRAVGERSASQIRARPLPGQGFHPDMKVECSSKMRNSRPIGSIFLITAKVKSRLGGPGFLYTSWQWGFKVMSQNLAEKFIAEGGWKV